MTFCPLLVLHRHLLLATLVKADRPTEYLGHGSVAVSKSIFASMEFDFLLMLSQIIAVG